jgi:uncharacterized protein (DUF58 family)
MLPVPGLLLEDSLPPTAGGASPQARFRLGALHPLAATLVEYRLPALPRGRFRIGPLRARLGDPLGMVELVRTFSAATEVVIVPRLEPLDGAGLLGGHDELGASGAGITGALGADDLTVRRYRPGDDLRKIHWRSSARANELMVRQEHRPRQGDVTVVVDTRAGAHRGTGADSSFEWLVAAAGSIAEHLSGRGLRVRLAAVGSAWVWPSIGGADSLADLQLDGGGARPSRGAVRFGANLALSDAGAPEGGTVIVLAGMPGDDLSAADLAALGAVRGRTRILLALRSASWDAAARAAGAGGKPAPMPSPGPRPGLRELAEAGWRVVLASHGDAVGPVWAAATGPAPGDPAPASTAASQPAAMAATAR